MSTPDAADWEEFRGRIPFLVQNYRGLCFAALATPESIMAVARCTRDEAAAIKTRALDDFHRLLLEVEQAKRRLIPARGR